MSLRFWVITYGFRFQTFTILAIGLTTFGILSLAPMWIPAFECGAKVCNVMRQDSNMGAYNTYNYAMMHFKLTTRIYGWASYVPFLCTFVFDFLLNSHLYGLAHPYTRHINTSEVRIRDHLCEKSSKMNSFLRSDSLHSLRDEAPTRPTLSAWSIVE